MITGKEAFLLLALLVTAAGAMAGEYDVSQLKKLFTDKNERASLDALRSGKGEEEQTKKVTVKGYMTRSHGKSVVWVNGGSTLDGNRVGNVSVNTSTAGRNKSVIVSSDGRHKKLKPGETWNRQTGKVVDGY